MLKNTNLSVAIWSDNYENLAKWYVDILGVPVREKLTLPNDTGWDLDVGSNFLYIGRHDKVHGKSKDPYRVMVGFHVESIAKTYKILKKKNVRFIAKPFEGPPGGFWCMTIADPEGNILQFYGDK